MDYFTGLYLQPRNRLNYLTYYICLMFKFDSLIKLGDSYFRRVCKSSTKLCVNGMCEIKESNRCGDQQSMYLMTMLTMLIVSSPDFLDRSNLFNRIRSQFPRLDDLSYRGSGFVCSLLYCFFINFRIFTQGNSERKQYINDQP